MQQYIYEDYYRGKPRKLLILLSPDNLVYRVFWESALLGIIELVQGDNGKIWKTDYNALKPIVAKIGAFIESLA